MIHHNPHLFGKWIVSYPPQSASGQQVLEICHDIQSWLLDKNLDRMIKRIRLNSSDDGNNFSISGNSITLNLKEHRLSDLTEKPSVRAESVQENLFPKEPKTILLLYPAMLSDKRWKTIQVPPSWLFLGSSLVNHHFQVDVEKFSFPGSGPYRHWFSFDILGFILYEDMFASLQPLLNRVRDQYQGLLAAGGPMVTLNPLESAYHLPEINLMVRGEAEFVFPGMLRAIGRNDLAALLKFRGFLFRRGGLMIMSDFDRVNRPWHFNGFHFNLDFLNISHLGNGLEANVSRGCSRGCIFCSRLQGKTLRKIPVKKIEQLLVRFAEKIKSEEIAIPESRTININDDDLLQDPVYARKIFQLIKKHGFRLWGIQSSVDSFFKSGKEVNTGLIGDISDPDLYVNQTPLLWLGTDAFLKKRGKKLGKMIPDKKHLESLIRKFEESNIRNYHYWISSDHLSDWEEFSEELLFLLELKMRYSAFHILAHAPFLIPYSSTPLYRLLADDPEFKRQIIYRSEHPAGRKPFVFRQAERVETRFPFLNRLLKNESTVPPAGFFDYLKSGDILNTLKTAYNFMKQERLGFESSPNQTYANRLKILENKIENQISEII
jgi:hypothetical protein